MPLYRLYTGVREGAHSLRHFIRKSLQQTTDSFSELKEQDFRRDQAALLPTWSSHSDPVHQHLALMSTPSLVKALFIMKRKYLTDSLFFKNYFLSDFDSQYILPLVDAMPHFSLSQQKQVVLFYDQFVYQLLEEPRKPSHLKQVTCQFDIVRHMTASFLKSLSASQFQHMVSKLKAQTFIDVSQYSDIRDKLMESISNMSAKQLRRVVLAISSEQNMQEEYLSGQEELIQALLTRHYQLYVQDEKDRLKFYLLLFVFRQKLRKQLNSNYINMPILEDFLDDRDNVEFIQEYDNDEYVRVFLHYLKYIQSNEYSSVLRLRSITEKQLVKKALNHFQANFKNYPLKAQLRLLWFVKVLSGVDKSLGQQLHFVFRKNCFRMLTQCGTFQELIHLLKLVQSHDVQVDQELFKKELLRRFQQLRAVDNPYVQLIYLGRLLIATTKLTRLSEEEQQSIQAIMCNCLQRVQMNVATPIANNHLTYMSSISNLQNFILQLFQQMVFGFPRGQFFLFQVRYLLLLLDSNNFIRQSQAHKLNLINLQQIQLILFSVHQQLRDLPSSDPWLLDESAFQLGLITEEVTGLGMEGHQIFDKRRTSQMFEIIQKDLEKALQYLRLSIYNAWADPQQLSGLILRQFFIVEGVCIKLIETKHVTNSLSMLKEQENEFINQVLEKEGLRVVQVQPDEWGILQKNLAHLDQSLLNQLAQLQDPKQRCLGLLRHLTSQ